MGRKLENVKGLYLEGIRQGKIKEALDKYIGNRYTQHSTGVSDGKEGFIAFFEPFVKRNKVRDISIVRGLEDGQYVFVHAYQDIDHGKAQWVTADFFDTDENDKIIEHWDCIQAYEEKSVSGRTMVDGPAEIEDLEKTEENKTVVKNFFEEVMINGNISNIAKYISNEQYDQHNPHVGDGLDIFLTHLNEFVEKGVKARYQKVHKLVGQGNFVATLSEANITLPDGTIEDYANIDIFRLKDGLIVEHWDVQEKILPKEQWGNSGKF